MTGGQVRETRPSLGDLVAGTSVALVVIPQSLAYAELAGVPPHIGLFAAALPPLLAAPFVSSPYLQTGPVALTALLTAGALDGRAPQGTAEYVELAALLAVIVGVARLVLGLARLGGVSYLMSEPVLTGFTSAAGVLIVSSQMPKTFGVQTDTGDVLGQAADVLADPSAWELEALLFAGATAVLMIGGRRIHRLFPGVLVAVIGGVVVSIAAGYDGSTVGDLPGGFIDIGLDLPVGETGGLVLAGLVIALVGFAEPASISRTFAIAERRRWDASREMVSQGVANVASGISGAFPVGGSFSRSSLNHIAGATSRWSGAVTGAVVLAALPLSPALEDLPRSVLGAIVITAVVPLIRIDTLVRITLRPGLQGVVAWGTFVATIATSPNVERGVLIGIGLAIAVHLWRETSVDLDTSVEGERLVVRPRGVIWFATAAKLDDRLRAELSAHTEVTTIVIDMVGVGRLDYSGGATLARTLADMEASGTRVELVNVPPGARRASAIHLGDRFDPPDPGSGGAARTDPED